MFFKTLCTTLAMLYFIGIMACNAHADLLCAKKKMRPSKDGKVTFSKGLTTVTGSNCPKGYKIILDTTIFQGPQGPQGPAADPWGRIPPGITVFGGITRYDWSGASSFHASLTPATAPFINNEDVILKLNDVVLDACPDLSDCLTSDVLQNSVDKSHLCEGTFESLAAPPGSVCIYPTEFRNIKNLHLYGDGNLGFEGWWNSSVSWGDSSLQAGWAYTAPLTSELSKGQLTARTGNRPPTTN